MNDDTDGCAFGAGLLIVLAVVACAAWSDRHPTPEQIIQRQQAEQRASEDRDLAEWNRTQQLREMRADKARAEDPKP